MHIVGVTGFKGSGKDTFAQPLIEAGYLLLKFAGPLKAMLGTLLSLQGVSDEDIADIIEGSRKEDAIPEFNGKTSRWAQQSLGTEWGRTCMGNDFWIAVAGNEIASAESLGVPGVVFTDVRFPNEAEFIYGRGGTMFRINRRAIERSALADPHPSETYVPTLKVHADIRNDGESPEAFAQFAGQYLKQTWGLI